MQLYYEDSFSILPQMDGQSVDMILTDPPYNFELQQRDTMQAQMMRVSRGAVIVFSPPENQWAEACDQWLFWVKPISTKNTSKSYSRFIEMIQVWNGETWNADRHWSQYTNVFNDLVDDKLHPYAKPLSMLERLIKNHTNVGDTVLDPFMGSGTTGLACKNLGRNFIGIEKDEEYFKIAQERINGH